MERKIWLVCFVCGVERGELCTVRVSSDLFFFNAREEAVHFGSRTFWTDIHVLDFEMASCDSSTYGMLTWLEYSGGRKEEPPSDPGGSSRDCALDSLTPLLGKRDIG